VRIIFFTCIPSKKKAKKAFKTALNKTAYEMLFLYVISIVLVILNYRINTVYCRNDAKYLFLKKK